MTGDDASYYTLLAHGADGGIPASAHLATERFVAVHARMAANDHHRARAIWSGLEGLVPLLFKDANPMLRHAGRRARSPGASPGGCGVRQCR